MMFSTSGQVHVNNNDINDHLNAFNCIHLNFHKESQIPLITSYFLCCLINKSIHLASMDNNNTARDNYINKHICKRNTKRTKLIIMTSTHDGRVMRALGVRIKSQKLCRTRTMCMRNSSQLVLFLFSYFYTKSSPVLLFLSV